MGINAFYAATVSPWLRKTELGERLDMALVAFNANLQFVRFMYAESGSRIFSEQEIAGIFSDLDSESLAVINRFMARQYKAPPNGLMVHPKYFYTEAEEAQLEDIINGIRNMPFAGFAVTKPNKVEVLKYLDEQEPLCKSIGACNTVAIREGRLIGFNTDSIGFAVSIKEETDIDITKSTFFCAGAGGCPIRMGSQDHGWR